MFKRIAALLALTLAVSSTSVFACPGDKAKADGKPETSKPKTGA